eukprot:jgi/Chrzof1/13707/Cz08g09010.t1
MYGPVAVVCQGSLAAVVQNTTAASSSNPSGGQGMREHRASQHSRQRQKAELAGKQEVAPTSGRYSSSSCCSKGVLSRRTLMFLVTMMSLPTLDRAQAPATAVMPHHDPRVHPMLASTAAQTSDARNMSKVNTTALQVVPYLKDAVVHPVYKTKHQGQ